MIGAVATLAVLIAASIALATTPVKGGSYRGSLAPPHDSIAVAFKVSSDGKQVRKLNIGNTPIFCEAGGPPLPLTFKRATISKEGTFKSSAQLLFKEGPSKGKVQVKLKITGKFLKRRRARGTLTVDWNLSSDPKGCDGKSKYTATA